jgi:urea carboxylase-associated protein 2
LPSAAVTPDTVAHGFEAVSKVNERSTATLAGARDHARSQAGAAPMTGPTVPPTAARDLPPGVAPAVVLWDEVVPGGGYAACRVPRDGVLQVTDLEGDACVQLLVYRADHTAERLNVADTVKVQWQAYLAEGAQLLSDMGRVLMTIVDDTSARHDCLGGCSNRRGNDARYRDGSMWGPAPNGRDLLGLGAAKHGLGRVDLGPPVNLFKSVRVDGDGGLHLDGAPRPGSHVSLRAELDVIVVVANTPHPLDDRATYTVTPARCTAWLGGPRADEPATPERQRAFENTGLVLRTAGR